MNAEKWWNTKHKLEAIDPHVRMEDGITIVTNSPDPADDGRAKRLSAVYETSDSIGAVHFYKLASGRITGPFWSRNCVSIARGDIRRDRCGEAMLAAEPVLRAALDTADLE